MTFETLYVIVAMSTIAAIVGGLLTDAVAGLVWEITERRARQRERRAYGLGGRHVRAPRDG